MISLHSLAEGTLVTGLEVALVHSPRPAEGHGQPQQQDRGHPTEEDQRPRKLTTDNQMSNSFIAQPNVS